MHDIGPGGLFQPFHEQVVHGAGARRAVIQFARIGLRISDELAERLYVALAGLANITSGMSASRATGVSAVIGSSGIFIRNWLMMKLLVAATSTV